MKSKMLDVIIAGSGLSGLAVGHFLEKLRPGLKVLLLEKTSRPGGAIRTLREDGYLAEWGPHGFLDNVEESRELLADLDLEKEAQRVPLKTFERFICLNGKLVPLPQTPPRIIKSKVLPFHKKLRVLADLWKKPLAGEQTIADWAAYRFGRAILPFADIALTGTYAGDINKLSIDAALPGLRRLELENGSVFRGAIKAQTQKTSTGMPSMVSFEQGMERLIEKIAENADVRFNTPVEVISKDESIWQIQTETETFRAKNVVLALHINGALPVLDRMSSAPKKSVPEAIVLNTVMSFGPEADVPFGFGYLAPKKEKRFAMGALFPAHMFSGRCPENTVTLEALVGGTRNPERVKMKDRELIDQTYQDVKQLVNLPDPPLFSKVIRPQVGLPQLEMGHAELQKYRDRMEIEHPGLFICGMGWEGIGMNEMIKQAKITAKKLLEGRPDSARPAEAKGIYF